jgi:superfamily I DNA/RNA helicase
MGAELRLYYKNLKGLIDSVPGIALGSDGTPNGVRVLIQDQEAKGFMDGIFGFDVNNVRVAEGLLSDEYLKSQGIEAGVPSDVNPDLLPNIADIPRADITPDDIRLANEGIESPEGKENEEFKNTPEGQEIARLEEAETVSSEELKDIVEPEMSDEDYDRAVDAIDNFGVRGPRGVGKPRTAAREDLDSLLDEESLQELAEDIYYQREGTKRAGTLSKALGADNPAVDAYGDDGQDPQWNEVYNKTWKDIAKKIFSDPNVVDAKAALPYGREDAYEDDVDPDLRREALNTLAADLGVAAKKALLPVAPPKKQPDVVLSDPPKQDVAEPKKQPDVVLSDPPKQDVAEPKKQPDVVLSKPAAKAKTANDLTPEALAALKEKNAIPQDDSTLRGFRGETVSNIVNDAYDKDEKTVNRTLKKLHGFLSKPDADSIGTRATIERLSNIVEAIGGTPYTPPAPKKEEDKFPERGQQNIEDYKVGDNVNVYEDSYFGDETTVDMGKVVGIDKNSDGVPVLRVKFDNDVDPDRSWPIEQKDLSPVSEADLKAKELLERGMAGEDGDALAEGIMQAPIDFDDEFDESDLEITEDPTDGLDGDITPDITDDVEDDVDPDQLGDDTEKPEFDRASLISDEELDAMGDPEEYREDFGGQFAPSKEQTRALNAIVKGKLRTVIDALAGAGKTTTLIGAANAIGRLRPNDRVLILTFNKKNAEDAKRKSPKNNTDARTTHSLAYAALTANQKKAMKPKGAGIAASDKDVAALLELDDTYLAGQNLSPADTAFLLGKVITKFSNSADDEITEDHFRSALFEMLGDDGVDYGSIDIPEKLMTAANKYWENVTSDEKVGYWDATTRKLVGKKRIRVTHDHSLKMWSLSNPDLSQLQVNGKPVSVVFFDEAQDTNPAVAKVIANNLDKVQIAYVGDPNQAIYTFRGAENALEDAKLTTEAVADLTVTRRFGEGLTSIGNGFLNLLGAARRVRGVGSGGEMLSPEDMPDGPEKAHLVRTNVGGLDAIMAYMEQGKTVGALSVFYDELEKSIYHLKWLSEDFKTRGKEPKTPDGRPAFSEDFIGINNFKDLYDKAKKDPKSRAARWYNLITMQGDGDIKKFEEILEKLVIDNKDSAEASAIIDTDTGASGTMWVTKAGKTLEYSIDEDGMVSMEGSASFEYVDGAPFKDLLKGKGMRWSGTAKQWQILLPDDEERSEFINSIANQIPNRVQTDSRVPDVVISTAHRAKGLEWDYVVIGDDFPAPKESLKTGELEWPSEEEMRLAYVAVTRARKGLSTGSLAWGDEFQGRDGLVRANGALGRVSDFGKDAWDYYDNQGEEPSSQAPSNESNFEALDNEDYNSFDADGDVGQIMSAPGDDVPFVKDWVQLRPGEYSKYISGVRWNIRENRDGSIVARPRTNELELGSTKYGSWEELEADFPRLIEKGNKVGRQKLKEALQPYDADGKLAQLIDSGASADEVNDALTKTDAWSDAVEGGTAPLSTIAARLSKYDGQKDVIPAGKKRPTAKPPVIAKKTFTPSKSAEFYDENPNRQDRGSFVDRTPYDSETLGKLKTDGKPRNVKNTLLRAYPGAVVTRNGRVVVYRMLKEEKFGPAKGQDREIEIGVMEGKDGTFTLDIKVTNPITGETKTYYHYKDYHSLASLIGDREKQSASIERLLSYYFDRDEDEFPFPGKTPKEQAEWAKMYGGIEGSIAYLRRGDFDKILEDPTSDDTQLKLRTPEEHAIIALNGRDRRFNKSTAAWWTQMRKEKASLFQALESGDTEAATAIFRSYINGVPDTEEAKSTVKGLMTRAMDQLYPDSADAKAKKALLSRIYDEIDQELPPSGSVVKSHLSRNGRQVERGNYVQWNNNEGETVIGQVSGLLGADNPNGGKYFYSDFAYVTFANRDEKNAVLLNTKNMEVLDEEADVTDYSAWIRNDDLKLRRYEEAGYTFDPETGIFFDPEGNPVDRLTGLDDDEDDDDDSGDGDSGDDDAGDEDEVIEPEEAIEPETPTIESKSIVDLADGDKVYDDNDELIGTVKSKKPAKYKGTPGYVVEFEDGKKSFYPEDEKVRSESDLTKQTTPAALKKRAARLGLSAGATKAAKTLPIRNVKSASDEGAVPIEGTRGQIGATPTPEARAAKNEMMEIGSAAWNLAQAEIVKEANALGLKGNSMAELRADVASIEGTRSEFSDARKKAFNAAEKPLDDAINEMNLADNAQELMDGLKQELRDMGVNLGSFSGIKAFYKSEGISSIVSASTLNAMAILYLKKNGRLDEAKKLSKAADEASEAYDQNTRDIKAAQDSLAIAERKGTVGALKKLGVKFDSVKFKEFSGTLVDDSGKPILDGSSLEVARAFEEAMQFMPRSVIQGLIAHLKETGKKLTLNKRGVSRGDFSPVAGGYRIRVSAKNKSADLNKYTDTMLHEVWHALQRAIPNLRALEHAWTYDRVSENNAPLKIHKIQGRSKELGLEANNAASPYMFRQYSSRTNGVFFNPQDTASEVATVLMQDMFTDPGYASKGSSDEMTVVGDVAGKRTKLTATYDKETESWYSDSTKATKVDNVTVIGRSLGQGVDRDVKSLGMGLLMVLNDWSATEGVGPGNAVDTDGK